MEKNAEFPYYMHIIWNAPYESENLGKWEDDILTYGAPGGGGIGQNRLRIIGIVFTVF